MGALQDIPYSHEAEERLLGAVLVRPDLFPQIAAELGPDDFFITRHRYVWQAISDLASQRGSWEFLTVAEKLQLQGRLADVGGQPFLIGLTTVADSSYAETYAGLIRAAAARRRLEGEA